MKNKDKPKRLWNKIFAILVLLLFLGTIVTVALINIVNRFILEKTP